LWVHSSCVVWTYVHVATCLVWDICCMRAKFHLHICAWYLVCTHECYRAFSVRYVYTCLLLCVHTCMLLHVCVIYVLECYHVFSVRYVRTRLSLCVHTCAVLHVCVIHFEQSCRPNTTYASKTLVAQTTCVSRNTLIFSSPTDRRLDTPWSFQKPCHTHNRYIYKLLTYYALEHRRLDTTGRFQNHCHTHKMYKHVYLCINMYTYKHTSYILCTWTSQARHHRALPKLFAQRGQRCQERVIIHRVHVTILVDDVVKYLVYFCTLFT
jgi:hypothetical protein